MDESREELFAACKEKLLQAKEEKVNGMQGSNESLHERLDGDEGDMAQTLQNQAITLAQRERVLNEIKAIDRALFRMEEGEYGICIVTGEPIEDARLLAIPWTLTSLAGAEIQEKQSKRFA